MRNGTEDNTKKIGDTLEAQKEQTGVRSQNTPPIDKQKRVLIFARVSTKDQQTKRKTQSYL
ncbi:MAG TPA: hypothetical protein VJB87_00695 [Candidatus Nanoarchaeia archaeon]|nr:hypothetical protein [Candidatus Nanoarchaeia archaeon]